MTDQGPDPNGPAGAESNPTVEDKSREGLRHLLATLEADLEDLEEERMFVLGQTGVHLSASTVRRYDTEVVRLKERIDEIRRMLESTACD